MSVINASNDSRMTAVSGSAETVKPGKPWTIIIFLFFFMFINFADRAVLGLAAGPLMKDLGITPKQFGMAGGAFFLFYTVFAVILGFVVNKVQTRWMLFVLALVWSAAQFPMMMSTSFTVLIVTRMILGAGEGPAYPAAIHSAFKWFPDEKRTLPVSVIAQGSALGVIIAAPTLTWIIHSYGWQTAFGILGVIGIIWAVCWLFVAEEGPISTNVTAEGDELERVPYWRIICNPTILSTWLCVFAAYWILSTVLFWFPSYMGAGLGLSKSSVGWLAALPWAGGGLMMFAVGWSSQKLLTSGYSSRLSRGIFVCVLGLIGAACLIALPMVDSLAAKLAIVTIGVILPNAVIPTAQAIVGELSPVPQRGAVLGIGNAFAGSAGAVAPYVAGSLVQSATQPIQGYEMAFVVCGLVVGVASVLGIAFINPTKQTAKLAGWQKRAAKA